MKHGVFFAAFFSHDFAVQVSVGDLQIFDVRQWIFTRSTLCGLDLELRDMVHGFWSMESMGLDHGTLIPIIFPQEGFLKWK